MDHWLFEELRAGRPGVLKLSVHDEDVLNRSWGSAGRAAFEPKWRALIKTYEQHEGGKDSISWLKADNAADFAVFDRLANSLLRDLEAVLLNHPSHQQQQTPAPSNGKRKRESTLADLNASDTDDCVSRLTLFRYAPGGESEQHEDRGLLTFIYCRGDESLKDSSGKSVVAKEGEIIVLAGRALEIASGGKFPAALHSVANIRRERFSLVFRCRGSSSAVLDPKRFAPSSRQSEQTLEQFYAQFEVSHRSVNAQSSGAAAAASSKAPTAAAAAATTLGLRSKPPVTPAPLSDGAITLILRSHDRDTDRDTVFKVKPDIKFEAISHVYAAQKGMVQSGFHFTFDGSRLNQSCSPKMLEMKDGDVIHVRITQVGD